MSLLARQLAKYGQGVTIEDRNMSVVNGQAAEVFDNSRTDIAIICTVKGVTVFDNTNVERIVTHKFTMAYRSDIGAEQWIRKTTSTKRLKILSVENCNERDTTLIVLCTERGEGSQVVNEA